MSKFDQRVDAIFEAATEMEPESRSGFIESECAGDPALREQVKSLLSAFDAADAAGFLAQPTGGLTPGTEYATENEQSPATDVSVDNYKLLEIIGEGGFGTVYSAMQQAPIRRKVALKIIKLGMDTNQVVARFQAERQALAMMDHPCIARVYDAGATENGRPYFVMELVEGVPITRYCDQHRLTIAERLELFQSVCAAVQHAHQKGIIHRDLKPSNILVTQQDGGPTPKVIDFGIAKATLEPLSDTTLLTQQRQLLGTPAYMSPEQAGAGRGDIDTRSDIYALGVLLYELLAGCPPFDFRQLKDSGVSDVERMIREVTPARPSTRLGSLETAASIAELRRSEPRKLTLSMSGDLDWIVMKAIEKDRDRRYESASAFAADIGRHLSDETVEASPPSVMYSATKFVRRHRLGFVLGTSLAAAMILGLAGTTAFAIRSQRAESRANAEAIAAQLELERATEIKTLLSSMLTSISPEIAKGRDNTMLRVVLAETAERIAAGEISDELVRAEISTVLAAVYEKIGDFQPAAEFARAAYSTRSQILGDESPDTIESRGVLANAIFGLGEHDEAERLVRLNIKQLSETYGVSDRRALAARQGLYEILADATPDEKVASEIQQLVSDTQEAYGADDPDTFRARQLQTVYLVKLGRVAEAEAIQAGVASGMRNTLGEDAPETILAIIALGTQRVMLGRLDEAEPKIREGLERAGRVFGDRHPVVPAMMSNLAYLLLRKGEVEEALQVSRDAVAMQSELIGEDHPSVIHAMVNLGGLLASTQRFEEATELMTRALALSRRINGQTHPNTLRLLNNLGGVLIEQERMEEARPVIEEALEHKRAIQGSEHHDTLRSMINLGTIHEHLGQTEQAADLYEAVYEVRARTLDPTDSDRLRSVIYLVPELLEMDRFQDALEILQAELTGARAAWEDQNPLELATMLTLLGRSQHARGDLTGARATLLEAYGISKSDDDSDPSDQSRAAARALVSLFEDLDQQQPNAGFDQQAARFRAVSAP